jgi:hypothetical protein
MLGKYSKKYIFEKEFKIRYVILIKFLPSIIPMKKNKIIGLLFYISYILCSGCNNQNNWSEFTSEENNFKIKFPEKPLVHDAAFLGSGSASIKIEQYDCKEGDWDYKALSYSASEDLIHTAGEMDSLFNNFIQTILFENKGTLINKIKIKIKEHPGEEFTVKLTDKGTSSVGRIFLMANNKIQVNMATGRSTSSKTDHNVKYFLDSFELMNEY